MSTGSRLQPLEIPAGSAGARLTKKRLKKLQHRALISISYGVGPTKTEAAKGACRSLAQTIAGDPPPTWFVNYLEHSVVRLALQRGADEGRHKRMLKKLLHDFAKVVAAVNEAWTIRD